MVLYEPLLVGVALCCRRVVAFRVVVLRRVFSLLPFSDILLFCHLLLHIVCRFFVSLLGVAVRRVVAVRHHNGVRHLMGYCLAGRQVCHLSMFAGMEVVLLTAFCLFVDYRRACCRFEIVGYYCICPAIVIEDVFRRVCCILCPLLNLICIKCLKVICFCHILILVPL
jgi:hypothetical protein